MHQFQRKEVIYRGHKIMTYSYGQGDETLLLVSGGPGCPCNFLRDTHGLYADQGFHVVTWDQLGCGESDVVDDPSFWEIDRFVDEVEHVRKSLNLRNIHLLGQSWGGVLGLEYLLKFPDLVKTFIITSGSFNLPLMQRGFERHKAALGPETVRMMAMREGNRTTDHPEYQAAYTLLVYRHLCRLPEWPECFLASLNISKKMCSKMFGNALLNCTGLLRNYDRIGDLWSVKQPCLLLHGEYDYIVAECATQACDHLPNAELHILKNCSHHTFLEDPQTYHQLLSAFLSKNKNSQRVSKSEFKEPQLSLRG
jgi:proline iminopeptidase